MIEFLLDCLWILSQGVIGFAIIMLLLIGASTLRNTYNDFRRRMEERAEKKWNKN